MAKRLGSKLFVNKLSFFTTHQDLKTLFSPFGVVKEAKLIRDPKTQRPKGFGFVTFETENEAQKALKAMNGRFVRGRLIFVEFANNRSPKNDTDS
ncbi:small RNA-binding protein 11, chloroplastic-like [Herrania umbratica]|uniref:Small RNA-binding protein 11, chloroplastic-like n=1 Tax=Herrania umbratica TaxID=108875 RepID=A0A6J0ZVG0_9ROSI|nr:small RNA-binding protein 11, chloroplastic-like [Herrania umbratica]